LIGNGAAFEGANPIGFTGLLSPVAEAMPLLEGFIRKAFSELLEDRIDGLADALKRVALEYGKVDEEAEAEFQENWSKSQRIQGMKLRGSVEVSGG
jgi:hypothetical protein